MEKHIQLPLTEELAKTLHAGDTVYLTGTIYTSRDAGHHGRSIRIHTAAGGRTCRSDDLAWFCRGRSYVVNRSVCRIKRDFFSSCVCSDHDVRRRKRNDR